MPDPLMLEAQFNRANISNKDFTEAEDYLHAYRDELSDILKRALLVAAIVATRGRSRRTMAVSRDFRRER